MARKRNPPYKLLKAFIAGLTVPAVIFGVFLYVALYFKLPIEFLYVFPLAPIVWGLWNFAYVEYINYFPAEHHLGGAGALLGFILALLGIFVIDVPKVVGLTGYYKYALLIIVPVFYYLIWHFLVHKLNRIFGIHD